MALTPGSKLGPYEIHSPLGAGGMGEVYRARDARLQREVAIKIIPSAFARDVERLMRFGRRSHSIDDQDGRVRKARRRERADSMGIVMWNNEGPSALSARGHEWI